MCWQVQRKCSTQGMVIGANSLECDVASSLFALLPPKNLHYEYLHTSYYLWYGVSLFSLLPQRIAIFIHCIILLGLVPISFFKGQIFIRNVCQKLCFNDKSMTKMLNWLYDDITFVSFPGIPCCADSCSATTDMADGWVGLGALKTGQH